MRGNEEPGAYMRWYCCGIDGAVEPWIAIAMQDEGWIWRHYPKVNR
jgi:hypothetical protein